MHKGCYSVSGEWSNSLQYELVVPFRVQLDPSVCFSLLHYWTDRLVGDVPKLIKLSCSSLCMVSWRVVRRNCSHVWKTLIINVMLSLSLSGIFWPYAVSKNMSCLRRRDAGDCRCRGVEWGAFRLAEIAVVSVEGLSWCWVMILEQDRWDVVRPSRGYP